MTTPAWYKTAVFYEVPVYAFADSTGNGVGDFVGLASKLDYLADLGIDCLWLLPFYESPLRDGGYDVSDFARVLDRYGSIDDIRDLVAAAHERGMRVIADLVLNHTSDQHPWFVEARRPGSAKRDWYVWSDTKDRYAGVRVIFVDTHDSNWTWDDEAGAYYWHRFFWHQPDLNFDNPDVGEAMRDVVRFWLDVGFDGLRLDAVPYLYEREGTSCESLPETHEWLKELRAMVDEEFDDRVLLAEANQWPDEVVAYFGDDDECHMAFHFPVMPRIYIALASGKAEPIITALEETPPIPTGSQWGVFLRNHDELTLEMVDDDERSFMYSMYAKEAGMRKNVGIGRRLAPLLENDRRKLELINFILLSLPGSPVLYYGDEIGMGDSYQLPDRDGVRTPMQWTAEPGAGFSTGDPGSFYLPLVADERFAPAAVNVAAQEQDPSSLLNWTRGWLERRRKYPVMGIGSFVPVKASDPAVLAFLRKSEDVEVLVIANLSGSEVTFDIDVSGFRSPLTLGPFEYHWMQADQ